MSFGVEDLVHFVHGADSLGAEARAAHAHDVDSPDGAVAAVGDHKGREVLVDDGIAGHHGVAPDAAELMHSGEPADDAVIEKTSMSRAAAEGDHDDIVAYGAVMGDVSVGHKVIVAANSRGGVFIGSQRAGMDGHVFPDDVLIADLHIRHHILSPAHVLRGRADGAVGIKAIALAYLHVSVDINVSHKLIPWADLNVFADYAIRSDFGGFIDLGSGSHDGSGVYGHK